MTLEIQPVTLKNKTMILEKEISLWFLENKHMMLEKQAYEF